MKLLICTQAVDLDDPVLGFFHRWIAEFAKRCETVHVICLKEGGHDLPANVFVHSLGKESGRSRLKYIRRFYRYIREFRGEYDAVFVHMNPEYVCLGGSLWRLWGKRTVQWYVHKKSSVRLRIAVLLSDVVLTASRGSFPLRTKKLQALGHGIDATFFSPGNATAEPDSILFLGRLDPVKRVEVFVRALEGLREQHVDFKADVVGDPTDPASDYAHDVRNLASPLSLDGVLAMRPAVTNDAARDLFRSHAIYCNLTPSGSFDKTILEAMACGSLVVAQNDALRGTLPEKLIARSGLTEDVAKALHAALACSPGERDEITSRCRAWVEREQSLPGLIERILNALA